MVVVSCARCGAKNRVNEQAGGRPVCGRCGAALEAASGGGAAAGEEGRPRIVSDATLGGELASAGERPLLVDCWAPWCGPCRMIAPLLDQLAAEAQGRYVIAKLNVDENPRTSSQFGIQSIPTMLIFKQGKLVDRLVGAQPKQAIAARLAAHAS